MTYEGLADVLPFISNRFPSWVNCLNEANTRPSPGDDDPYER